MNNNMADFSRRGFVGGAVMLGAAALAGCGGKEKESAKVVHHVFFWLKAPASVAMQEKLIEGLETLRDIAQVKKLLIGRPAPTLSREVIDNSYHVSELIYFNSIAEQDAYQKDPVHKAFVEKYSTLWERVIVYDMLVEA